MKFEEFKKQFVDKDCVVFDKALIGEENIQKLINLFDNIGKYYFSTYGFAYVARRDAEFCDEGLGFCDAPDNLDVFIEELILPDFVQILTYVSNIPEAGFTFLLPEDTPKVIPPEDLFLPEEELEKINKPRFGCGGSFSSPVVCDDGIQEEESLIETVLIHTKTEKQLFDILVRLSKAGYKAGSGEIGYKCIAVDVKLETFYTKQEYNASDYDIALFKLSDSSVKILEDALCLREGDLSGVQNFNNL